MIAIELLEIGKEMKVDHRPQAPALSLFPSSHTRPPSPTPHLLLKRAPYLLSY